MCVCESNPFFTQIYIASLHAVLFDIHFLIPLTKDIIFRLCMKKKQNKKNEPIYFPRILTSC